MNYTANDNLEIMKLAKNYNNFLIKNVIKIIRKYKYKNIVDFGCSDGFFIQELMKFNTNSNFIGIETDETSYQKCIKNNINVFNSLDEISSQIDFLYSFNVLEHIEDDIEILNKINKKMVVNGTILIYVPAMRFLFSSMDVKTGHYRRYLKKELKNKIKLAGFKIEKIEYCDILGVFATLLYKLKDKFKNNNGDINPICVKFYDCIFPLSYFLDKLLFSSFLGKNLLVVARKV